MECKLCGAVMVKTPDKILTTYPALYEYKCPKCGHIQYQSVEVISSEHAPLVSESLIKKPDPWFNFRCVAAKDILVALVAKSGSESVPDINLVVGAIGMADLLIEQLKGEE